MRSLFNFTALSAALMGILFSSQVLSHNIKMGAHSRECFHEQLHKDDKMTVTFQVGDREFGGAGSLEIDFWVSLDAPTGYDVLPRCTTGSLSAVSTFLPPQCQ